MRIARGMNMQINIEIMEHMASAIVTAMNVECTVQD